jgi:hypothetical protein
MGTAGSWEWMPGDAAKSPLHFFDFPAHSRALGARRLTFDAAGRIMFPHCQ